MRAEIYLKRKKDCSDATDAAQLQIFDVGNFLVDVDFSNIRGSYFALIRKIEDIDGP